MVGRVLNRNSLRPQQLSKSMIEPAEENPVLLDCDIRLVLLEYDTLHCIPTATLNFKENKMGCTMVNVKVLGSQLLS